MWRPPTQRACRAPRQRLQFRPATLNAYLAPRVDQPQHLPAYALAITLDREPPALRSTRNRLRTAMHLGAASAWPWEGRARHRVSDGGGRYSGGIIVGEATVCRRCCIAPGQGRERRDLHLGSDRP